MPGSQADPLDTRLDEPKEDPLRPTMPVDAALLADGGLAVMLGCVSSGVFLSVVGVMSRCNGSIAAAAERVSAALSVEAKEMSNRPLCGPEDDMARLLGLMLGVVGSIVSRATAGLAIAKVRDGNRGDCS